ncbi:DUF433 domain-containing protein [Azohydromonas australica]|uniref:DUF433 domain-containing protein n=1 Tax=Azohydromonas australica TaxID=364039 RepID=UPI00048D786B|nr:DUF433 domain-containing protein [Azohydromonas australica]
MNQAGIGVYTLGAAARLIQADRRSISRWLYGYDYARQQQDGTRRQYHSSPLWTPQHAASGLGDKVLGFQDLLELRIVNEFVQHGVPLLVVRRCLEYARDAFGLDEYPLTSRRFCTDGRTIFQEVLKEGEEAEVLDLRTRQYVIREIIKPSLYAGIEYVGDVARRWYPEGRDRRTIVVDPDQQFGKPIIEEAGVPTETLYAAYIAEGRSKAAVAHIYEVTPRQVDAAVRFEERLAA